MVRIGKLLALSVLALELGILDLLAWFAMPIPFGWGSANLEVNHTLVPWPFLFASALLSYRSSSFPISRGIV